MTPTAHLLAGFIGCGKTTFAKRLESDTAAVRYTYDEWMIRMYGPNPPESRFEEYFVNVENLVWNEAERMLKAGRDVIVDAGFWTRESRDIARGRIAGVGAVAKFYSIICPRDVMLARTLKRSGRRDGIALWIDESAFAKLISRFEPMQADEEFTVVDGAA